MAHYVAKIIKQRPNDILDHWGVPELIVCFGQYANEETYKNFLEMKASKNKKLPKPYAVHFYSMNDYEDEEVVD